MKITYSIIALLFSVMTYAQVAETAGEVCPLLIGEKVPDIEIVSAENRTAAHCPVILVSGLLLNCYSFN